MFDMKMPHLRNGSGSGSPEDGLCLMQMVDFFAGKNRGWTDKPSCACPILTAYGIRLNDSAPSQDARDELWPLVFQLQGSRDPAMEKARLEFLIIETVRGPVADAFDAVKLPKHAVAMRGVNTLDDVRDVTAKAKNAAAYAAYAAAYAAAAAAYAAYAAAYAAYAAAYAAAAAAYAAAYAAYAVRLKYWRAAKDIFARAILLGNHGEADPVCLPRVQELRRVLAVS